MVYVEAFLFVIGVILLVKGADYFVQAASDIARRLGVTELVIGLTIVSIGTSLPELAAAISATVQGAPALVTGNIIGSNIANIALIAGIAVVFTPAVMRRRILVRDGYTMVFASSLIYFMGLDGYIALWEGVILVFLYATYMLFVMESRGEEDEDEYHFSRYLEYVFTLGYINSIAKHASNATTDRKKSNRKLLLQNGAISIISLVAVIYGAEIAIREAIYFAQLFSMPESVIGVTLVALGTSLPELSVTLAAVKKGFTEIVIGNVIGSNIANILLIGGIASIIQPLPIGAPTLLYTAPVMLIISFLFLFFIRTKWKLERYEGALLLAIYVLFIVLIFINPVWAG